MIYLRKAKYIVFGPEPVFAYALAKKRELQLFRLLGVGKLNQIPAEMLKQRMSETYV
jgi:V/A-type H+-transporting ATPase subunit C